MLKKNTFSGKTKTFCLIGDPVEHSMSPTMWNPALQELNLDYVYIAFNVHSDDLEKAINGMRALGIRGMNVTIPHKENVIKYLDHVEEVSLKIGAINTIKNENGYLIGRNTDAIAARKSLIDAGCQISGKKMAILGAGGVSRALCFILAEEASEIILVDIIEERAKNLAEEVKKKMDANIIGKISSNELISKELKTSDILINATPLGMYPKIDITPIPKEYLHPDLFIFDVVYNPLNTRLMKDAQEIGCKTLGGLDMLVNQGVLAFQWWTEKTPNSDLMKQSIIDFLGIV